MQKQTVLVKHLRYPLTAALERLMAKDPVKHPFVIVEAVSSDSFLQYCGSAGESLLMDVPQMEIQMECDNVAHAVVNAEQLIEHNWSLKDDDQVTIIEDQDSSIRGELTRKAKDWLSNLKERLCGPIIPEPA